MKQLLPVLLSAVALVALAGCGGSGHDDEVAQSRVRLVHASPDAPNVDIRINDTLAFNNVAYFGSGERALAAGNNRVRVNPSGSPTSVIDATLNFEANRLYTILAADRVATIQPLVINDPDSGPGVGQARVRLVHGSPSAGTVDIYVTAPGAPLPAEPTLSDVPFLAVASPLTVASGDYRVRITPANDPSVIAIDTGTISLPSNSSTIAVALDAAGGGTPLTARTYTKTY